ncbi:MAG TPA: hypothetical protein VL588_12100, partial [Bdellovibrionota bacterium]|nr:hypothetical protein [Bdellovibrionota bacterium]
MNLKSAAKVLLFTGVTTAMGAGTYALRGHFGVGRHLAMAPAPSRNPASPVNVPGLPSAGPADSAYLPMVTAAVKKGRHLSAEDLAKFSGRIAHYLSFLGERPTDKETKDNLTRLMNSSTEFILCDDLEDWGCLQQPPRITPTTVWRRDAAEGLGVPQVVDEPFRVESFFTDQWDKDIAQFDPTHTVARVLGSKISSDARDSMAMALYGMDDLDGSMKPVHDAILERLHGGTKIRAVFDTQGPDAKSVGLPLVFSLLAPGWTGHGIMAPGTKPPKTNMDFQYSGTAQLAGELNQGAATDADVTGRLEWPDAAIMHNKFLVLQNGDALTVWSGTANVSETCMGTERNANMSVYVQNSAVAQAFLDEFQEMFTYRDPPFVDGSGKMVAADGSRGLPVGRFHHDKTPNTHRYFKFNDGTEVLVHFSPTDDAE